VKINICGKEFDLGDMLKSSISVKKSKITVNGEVIHDSRGKDIKIEISGGVADITADVLNVSGDVNGDIKADVVNCGDVTGDIRADVVNCGDIKGKVDGDVVIGGGS